MPPASNSKASAAFIFLLPPLQKLRGICKMEEARPSLCAWDLLPSELWLAIFEYLPFPDIVKVKLICSTLR